MSENIGICGVIGSGKSHVAKTIAEHRNLHYVSADLVFKEDVLPNPEYVTELRKFLGRMPPGTADFDPFAGGVYQTKSMSEFLFQDPDDSVCATRLEVLNYFNSDFLQPALTARMHGRACVLEMATLPDYEHLPSLGIEKIACVVDDNDEPVTEIDRSTRLAAVARDGHRHPLITATIARLQKQRRESWRKRKDVWFITNRDRDGVYMTDTQIVSSFDSAGFTRAG